MPLYKARNLLLVVFPLFICAVAGMCFVEVSCLELLFVAAQEPAKFFLMFVAVIILLLLMGFALSFLCLQLTEAAQAAGVAETAVLILFAYAYTSAARHFTIQPIVYLVAGKILVTILLARFWHAKFREYRMRFRETPTARFFLVRKSRFFSCTWVVVGSWCITTLAFSLALVESQNLLQLQGWEGLILLLTFFLLFWLFVRNPNSHPNSFEDA